MQAGLARHGFSVGECKTVQLAATNEFAPWELGYVGTSKDVTGPAREISSSIHGVECHEMKLDTTTPSIAWTFQEPNVPQEVICQHGTCPVYSYQW